MNVRIDADADELVAWEKISCIPRWEIFNRTSYHQ